MSKSTQGPIETHCLNCGEELHGKYCSQCGQKAGLQKDSFGHMLVHFVGDYFHYDNKFWTTFRALITKPGQVTLDYIEGRRARYLNPIQLYIFVVTVMVLLTMGDANEVQQNSVGGPKVPDETAVTDVNPVNDSVPVVRTDTVSNEGEIGLHSGPGGQTLAIGEWTPKESSVAAYDSIQQNLPEPERDGLFKRMVRRKYLTMKSLGNDVFMTRFWNAFYHGIPKLLFLLLPFFALLLKLFFGRRTLYYVDHVAFSLHFHSMIFLLVIFRTLSEYVISNPTVDEWLSYGMLAGFVVYLFLSLMRVYAGRWYWTLIKQVLLMFGYLITFTASMILLLIAAFLMA